MRAEAPDLASDPARGPCLGAPRWLLGASALAAGAGTMAVEITAVRILAPWFGTSIHSWTNVIGVVLGCMAAGYFLGGILADKRRDPLLAGWALAAGGLLAGLSPLLLPGLAGLLVDPSLPLEAALGALAAGSFPAAVALFGPPVLLLGMVPPLLVQAWPQGDAGRLGRASGAVYALGTLGSLAGTFLPTWWLVPTLGSRATLLIAGGSLVGVGAALLAWRSSRRISTLAGACLFVPLGAAGFFQDRLPFAPPPPGGAEVLWEDESAYQYLRVVEAAEEGGRLRSLQLNEGRDSFHSVSLDATRNTKGRYYDALCLAGLLADPPLGPGARVLSLGCAAGTCLRLLEMLYGPGLDREGVEIDPLVIAAGRDWMGLESGIRLFEGVDARLFVRAAKGPYRFIVLDAYSGQIYIPFHLATVEFFEGVAALLEPGGVLAINVADPSGEGVLARPVAASLALAFPEVWLFHVPDSRNYMLAARRTPGLDPARLGGRQAPEALRALGAKLAGAGRAERVSGDPRLRLTDDRAPIEELTWASFRAARAEALR